MMIMVMAFLHEKLKLGYQKSERALCIWCRETVSRMCIVKKKKATRYKVLLNSLNITQIELVKQVDLGMG